MLAGEKLQSNRVYRTLALQLELATSMLWLQLEMAEDKH